MVFSAIYFPGINQMTIESSSVSGTNPFRPEFPPVPPPVLPPVILGRDILNELEHYRDEPHHNVFSSPGASRPGSILSRYRDPGSRDRILLRSRRSGTTI